jgi:hypothetical protein
VKSTQSTVDDTRIMVKEIYEWFKREVRDRESLYAAGRPEPPMSKIIASQTPWSRTFELSLVPPSSSSPLLLCPHAGFQEGWLDVFVGSVQGRTGVFRCYCAQSRSGHESGIHAAEIQCSRKNTSPRLTYDKKAHFEIVLPASLLVHQVGSMRTWQIFGYRKEITSFTIGHVAPQGKLICRSRAYCAEFLV